MYIYIYTCLYNVPLSQRSLLRCRARRDKRKLVQGLSPEIRSSQSQDLALTVISLPSLLDSSTTCQCMPLDRRMEQRPWRGQTLNPKPQTLNSEP